MIGGSESARFAWSSTRAKLYDHLEDELSGLGSIRVDDSGDIEIEPRSGSNGFTTTRLEGYCKLKEGRATVEVNYTVTLGIGGWLVAILLFPLGLVILFALPSAKQQIERSVRRVIRSLDERERDRDP